MFAAKSATRKRRMPGELLLIEYQVALGAAFAAVRHAMDRVR